MQQTSKQRQPFILVAGRILLERRWLVFVTGVLLVVTVETIEHWPDVSLSDSHFLNELFFYGIVGPLVVWALLTMLARALAADVPVDRIQAQATRAERRRIARDLHDQLAQNLGYLHLKLDQLATSDEATLTDIESIQVDLEQMRQIANQAYEQVRGTLDSLRTDSEIPDDLAVALRQQAQSVAGRTGLDIKVDYPAEVNPLCPLVKQTMIDIARESLTNVDKHAEASQVTLRVACNQTDVFLTVVDDGQGFRIDDDQEHTGHYGLEIMRERAEEVGGSVDIESVPGQGTQLIAKFPNTVVSKPLLLKCERLICAHLAQCKDEHSLS
jgi:two-component system nitrate/nitrite sensor histidine kinase NarX